MPLDLRSEQLIRGNCHVKTYPDGHAQIRVSDRRIFRAPGWTDAAFSAPPEPVEKSVDKSLDDERKRASLDRAKRRAKAALTDLALCNDFSYFVTLTLDRRKVDRYDVKEITRKLNHWLDNHVRRNGLKYVLVAEKHKDGAVHFHGFFNDALPVVDSGHVDKKGHTVYNLPAWDLGFTTAIALYGDKRAAVGYCAKYITKAQEKIGGRWYYSGGNLARPSVTVCDADFEAVSSVKDAYVCEIPGLGAKLATVTTEGGETASPTHAGGAPAPGGSRDRAHSTTERGPHTIRPNFFGGFRVVFFRFVNSPRQPPPRAASGPRREPEFV